MIDRCFDGFTDCHHPIRTYSRARSCVISFWDDPVSCVIWSWDDPSILLPKGVDTCVGRAKVRYLGTQHVVCHSSQPAYHTKPEHLIGRRQYYDINRCHVDMQVPVNIRQHVHIRYICCDKTTTARSVTQCIMVVCGTDNCTSSAQ